MIAELGHYALVIALMLGVIEACVPIYGARRNDAVIMASAGPVAVAQFAFVAAAFAALTTCYIRSDFSLVNVFENSHSAKPLIYKITGVWGNHEGSMLLWVLILSLFGTPADAVCTSRRWRDTHSGPRWRRAPRWRAPQPPLPRNRLCAAVG